MATNRMISTSFWQDTYVLDLDPIEKLLFLYLLTNHRTNIAGIYEISLRQMAFDTGIDKDMIQKILERFQKDAKIYYNKNWVALSNWIKHQSLNPKVAEGIGRIVENLPAWLQKELLEDDQARLPLLAGDNIEPMDSLSKPIALNLTKLNLTKPNAPAAPAPKTNNGYKKSYKPTAKKEPVVSERASQAKIDSVRDVLVKKGIVKPKEAAV